MSAITRMSGPAASRAASTRTSASSATRLSVTRSPGRRPLLRTRSTAPGDRRSLETLTRKGLPDMEPSRVPTQAPKSDSAAVASEPVLVEEPGLAGSVGLALLGEPDGAPLGRRQRRDLQLLSSRLHRLHGAVEHDLEGSELLVAVVLGLVPQPAGLVACLLDRGLGG